MIGKIGGALLGAMLLSSAFSSLLVGIMESINFPLSTQAIKMIGGCVASVGYLYCFYFFTKDMKKRHIKEVALERKFSVCDVGRYLFVALGVTVVISNITEQIVDFIKIYLMNGEVSEGIVETYMEDVPVALLFVCAVIIGPIFEEFLFRRVLLELLLPYGKVVAIAISSIFFGLCHANLEQLFYTMFLGMLCANIVVITGEIRYSIYLHMLFNLFGTIVSDFIPAGMTTTVVEIVLVMCAVLILILDRKTMFVLKEDCVEDFFRKKNS